MALRRALPDVIPARFRNQTLALLRRVRRWTASAPLSVAETQVGRHVSLASSPPLGWFWAEITSGSNPYAWKGKRALPGGLWEDDGSFAGGAWEVNADPVSVGRIVRMRPGGPGEDYRFANCECGICDIEVCLHAGFCAFSPIDVAGVAVTIETSPDEVTWTEVGSGTTDINGDFCVTLEDMVFADLPLFARATFGAWDCGAEHVEPFDIEACDPIEVEYGYPACSITAYAECAGEPFAVTITLEYFDTDLADWVEDDGDSTSIGNPCACPGRDYRAKITRCGTTVTSGTVTPSGCPASYEIHLEVPAVPAQDVVVTVLGSCGLLEGATVTITDGDGTEVSGDTDASGEVTLDVDGLLPCVTITVEAERFAEFTPLPYTLGCGPGDSEVELNPIIDLDTYACSSRCAYPLLKTLDFTLNGIFGLISTTLTYDGTNWTSPCVNISAFGIGSIIVEWPARIKEYSGAVCGTLVGTHSFSPTSTTCPPGAFSETGTSGIGSYTVDE